VLVLTLLYVRHACLMAGRLAELSVAECLAACQHCGFIWSTSALLVPLSPFNESTVARPINTQTLTNALSANTPQVNLSIIECSPSKQAKQTAWDLHAIISISIEEFHHTWVFSAFFILFIWVRNWMLSKDNMQNQSNIYVCPRKCDWISCTCNFISGFSAVQRQNTLTTD